MEYEYIIDLEMIANIQNEYNNCCKKLDEICNKLANSALANSEGIISSLYASIIGKYNKLKSFSGKTNSVWGEYINEVVTLENSLASDDRLDSTISVDPKVIVGDLIPRCRLTKNSSKRVWTDNSHLAKISIEGILSQFDLVAEGEISEEVQNIIYDIYYNNELSEERKSFAIYGLQWEGKIKYNLGSFVKGVGIIPKYLDCSHFVDFVAMNALDDWKDLDSSYQNGNTSTLLSSKVSTEISEDDLQIGDLGFFYSYQPSKGYNHVGIYLGKDEDGNKLWLHETTTGGAYNVIVGDPNFKVFRRLNVIEE